MKRAFYVVVALVVLVGCSPFQKALKSTDYNDKIAMIDTLMKKEKYGKSLQLFEQVRAKYRGTDSAKYVRIRFADALYGDGNFPNSAYQYESFARDYPSHEEHERSEFMAAKSHYEMSPVYSKDQTDTQIALAKLQDYINQNPEGEFAASANQLVEELRLKLDKKAYEIAKNYHHRDQYIPAIETFENFIVDHPGSEYQDDAHYYLLESEFLYASKSQEYLIAERMAKAKKYYENFKKRYPQSEYREKADELLEKINSYDSI